jgi:hypothetical protein
MSVTVFISSSGVHRIDGHSEWHASLWLRGAPLLPVGVPGAKVSPGASTIKPENPVPLTMNILLKALLKPAELAVSCLLNRRVNFQIGKGDHSVASTGPNVLFVGAQLVDRSLM